MTTLAELEREGWDGVSVWCGNCRYTTHLDFFRLQRLSLTLDATLASVAARLACRRCGGRRPEAKDVKAYYVAFPHRRPPQGLARPPNAAEC